MSGEEICGTCRRATRPGADGATCAGPDPRDRADNWADLARRAAAIEAAHRLTRERTPDRDGA